MKSSTASPSPILLLRRRTGHKAFTFKGGQMGCLLVHGFTGTAEEMRYLGDILNRSHGFTVHGVLLAGHGAGSETFNKTGWLEWYKSAEEGLKKLQALCDTCFVVGFSMGSLLSILLALNYKDTIKALALLATPLFVNRHKIRILLSLTSIPIIKGWLLSSRSSIYSCKPPNRKDLSPAHASFTHLKCIVRREIHLIRQPVLLIHSRKDDSVPWENTLLLERLLDRNIKKKMVILSRSRHVLPLDVERDRVVSEIADFFLGLSS